MLQLRNVGRDEPLSTEQGQLLRTRAVMAARAAAIGRKLLPTNGPLGAGVLSYLYDTLTEVADARIDMGWPGSESLDTISLGRTAKTIPLLHKETEINKGDLDAARLNGQPLNLSVVESLAYRVTRMEDKLIINGWSKDGTTYEVPGLYQSAGNSEDTNLGWGTGANIVTSVKNAIALLMDDNIDPPYNMVLNAAEYTASLQVMGTGSSRSYLEWVKEVIQGNVYTSSALTAGLGLMLKANPDGLFEWVLAEDQTVDTEIVPRSHNLFIRVYERGLPVIYDTTAICKLTDIGGS